MVFPGWGWYNIVCDISRIYVVCGGLWGGLWGYGGAGGLWEFGVLRF